MKKGFLRFYLIYQDPILVSQFFCFQFSRQKTFNNIIFYERIKKKETFGLLNKKLDEIRKQRNHHSLLKIVSNKKER